MAKASGLKPGPQLSHRKDESARRLRVQLIRLEREAGRHLQSPVRPHLLAVCPTAGLFICYRAAMNEGMLPIVQASDPVLRAQAEPVSKEQFGTPELDAMLDCMEQALDGQQDGVALAAPQIGISLRIFIVRHDRLTVRTVNEPLPAPEVEIYINPKVVRTSRKCEEVEEGCLSVRNVYGKTLRHADATVRAQRPDGSTFKRSGSGVLAQAFQHETDHLEGILFIDHATDLVNIVPEVSTDGVPTTQHEVS